MPNPNLIALDTLGQIEACARDIADLERRLNRVPLWQPGAILAKQAAEARRMINGLQERLDGHLVATLIGPSGAGKSTIFNALAGADELSPVGLQRPTTRELVVLAADPRAARQVLGPLEDGRTSLRSGPAARDLDHLILVDTPDTDSTESPGHLDLIYQIVERSDVLICVFDALNPKRRDHADFMAPLVRRFNGASLVAVVNKCDRHSEAELSGIIGPDFQTYLHQAWAIHPEALLLISARRHLKDPQWDPQAQPRHELDQFDRLRDMVMVTLNRPGAGRDRRVANAGRIRDYMLEQVGRAAVRVQEVLAQAAERIVLAEQRAMRDALFLLSGDDRRHLLGVNARLYQALAQRWLGPVGWLVAIWSRLIVFGTGLAALMRFGNPLRQLWGLASSWRRHRGSRSALEMLDDPSRADAALIDFRKTLMSQWPDIAKLLIDGGFDPAVHAPEGLDALNDGIGRTLDNLWADALDDQINRSARKLSHMLLQVIFNLPVVALMGYVGWLTAAGFFTGQYRPSDFFVHALLTAVIVLLLSFFLLQGLVRLAVGRDRIRRRAFDAMGKTVSDRPLTVTRSIVDQISDILDLAKTPPTH
jgi:energy-coupling factor transporter ATP-binding protein EcfA2